MKVKLRSKALLLLFAMCLEFPALKSCAHADVYSDNNVPENVKKIIEKMVNKPSCFEGLNGMERKSRSERIRDVIDYYNANKSIDGDQDDFNDLGLDIKNFRSWKDFLSCSQKIKEIYATHHGNLKIKDFTYDNKFNFYEKLSKFDPSSTPKIYFRIFKGKVEYPKESKIKNSKSAIMSLKNGKYIFKPVCGLQGNGIYLLEKSNGKIKINSKNNKEISLENFLKNIYGTSYLVEEYVQQHNDLAKLNSSSLNTVRVVSMRYNKNSQILASSLRIGNEGSIVDNAHQGGMLVGIDFKTGKLKKFICSFGKKTLLKHPKLGVSLEGYQIPYWKETIDLVQKLHNEIFWGASSLGFDVAITPKGPVIIEVNTGWCSKVIQTVHGGLKERFEELKKL